MRDSPCGPATQSDQEVLRSPVRAARGQYMIPHAVHRAESGDLEALVLLCAEHAAFERASFDSSGKLELLRDAIFGDVQKHHTWVASVDGRPAGHATATLDFSTWNADACDARV